MGEDVSVETALRAEVEELRARLEEAEETLRAIQSGEVDALVVAGPEGYRTFTLKGAEHPYRVIVEEMDEGAFTIDEAGNVLYANHRFAEMLRLPLEKVIGAEVYGFVAPSDRPTVEALLHMHSDATARSEVNLLAAGNMPVPTYFSSSALDVDGMRATCVVVTDLTMHKRSEKLVASERLARSILEQAAEAIVVCDDEGMVIRASEAAHGLCGRNPLYKPFDDLFPLRLHETGGQRAFTASDALSGEVIRGIEADLSGADGREFNLLVSAGPLREAGGEILGCVITLTDITERKRLEEQVRSDARIAAAEGKRLAKVLERMPVGVYFAEGEPEGRTIRWKLINELGRRMFAADTVTPGVTTETFTMLRPDGTPYAEEELPFQYTLWTGENAPDQEMILRYNDGSESIIMTSTVLIGEEDGVREAVLTAQDITERRRLEEEVRLQAEAAEAERKRLALVLEQLPVAVYIAEGEPEERTARWILINPEAQRQLRSPITPPGAVTEHFTVHRLDGSLYEDDDLPLQATLWKGEARHDEELLFRYAGGEERVRLVSTSILHEGGGTRAVIAVSQDITERKKLEEAVRHQAEAEEAERLRLTRILEHLPVGVMLAEGVPAEREIHWTFVNRAAREELRSEGAMPDFAGGRYTLYHPDGRKFEEDELAVEHCLATGEPVRDQEMVIRYRDGGRRVLLVTSDVVRSRGKTREVLGVMQDITDLKDAEVALAGMLTSEQAQRKAAEEAEQRFAFLAEAGSALASSLDYEATLHSLARLSVPYLADYCLIDLAGADGSLSRVAVAAADPEKQSLLFRLTAYPPHPGKAAPAAEAKTRGRTVVVRDLAERYEAIAENEDHLEVLRKLAPRTAIAAPLVARGRTLGTISFWYTEVAQNGGPRVFLAEELARRAALAVDNAMLYREAQEASHAREELLAVVSHDLKNPLAAIKGFAQVLRRRALRSSSPDVRQMSEGLGQIELASQRMNALLNELVDFARLQAGEPIDLHLQAVDLVAVTSACIAEQGAGSTKHKLVLDAELPELVGLWDSARLERLISNLLSNAIKYSPKGGKITVSIGQEATEEGAQAVLSVRDEGIGIPARDLTNIFEWYRRAGNATALTGGAGIGLAIAKQIAEEHGGTIGVDSEEGIGSVFTVRLPVTPPMAGR